jgi:hypothetical protein
MMAQLQSIQVAEATHEVELSIVMPCLNEAETLAICITKAEDALRRDRIVGEVIVADNGSTDGSQAIAPRLGAMVNVQALVAVRALLVPVAKSRPGRCVGPATDYRALGGVGSLSILFRSGDGPPPMLKVFSTALLR